MTETLLQITKQNMKVVINEAKLHLFLINRGYDDIIRNLVDDS